MGWTQSPRGSRPCASVMGGACLATSRFSESTSPCGHATSSSCPSTSPRGDAGSTSYSSTSSSSDARSPSCSSRSSRRTNTSPCCPSTSRRCPFTSPSCSSASSRRDAKSVCCDATSSRRDSTSAGCDAKSPCRRFIRCFGPHTSSGGPTTRLAARSSCLAARGLVVDGRKRTPLSTSPLLLVQLSRPPNRMNARMADSIGQTGIHPNCPSRQLYQ